MNQQQIFQQFFGPGFGPGQPTQQAEPRSESVAFNETLLEIANNWEHVKGLLKRYKEGKLERMDPLEQAWYGFVVPNGVDPDVFRNEEEFLDKHWKAEKTEATG